MITSTLADAVNDALRAPSVHNSQPWRWEISADAVHLHSDPERHLVATDPDRRDLVLSCGAALHHLRVALAARGLAADVRRLPDPEDSTHLATVTVHPDPDPADAALFPAIAQRRTDRRRMSRRPVPAEHLQALVEQAARNGATVLPVSSPVMRKQLLAAIVDAERLQREAAGYANELRTWTNRLPGGRDGVPAANVAAPLIGTVNRRRCGASATRGSPSRHSGPDKVAATTPPSCSSSRPGGTRSWTTCAPGRRRAPSCWPPRGSGSPPPRSARPSRSTAPACRSSGTCWAYRSTPNWSSASAGRPRVRRSCPRRPAASSARCW